jgi:predicted AlkP superfamily phosphohydrolase/phosphomutase
MRVLCLGLDGADYDLVRDLLAEGKLPTLDRLSREGTFGPLRSTIPAFTPTAWSSFLTGLNPGGHGIFSFSSNPNRATGRLESAASRAGAPLWRMLGAAGLRSAFVTVPFTHPPEPLRGLMVTGFGGPQRPEIVPAAARAAILSAHPDLLTAHHPTGWSEDFVAFAERLVDHVGQIADVCLLALELEPDLGLLCVDFMSSDIAGHLAWHRLDPTHPAHSPEDAGDELIQVYEAIDRACGELVEQARWLWGEEPTVLILSDHGMKPTHWVFRANRWLEQAGYLRYRAGSATPAADATEIDERSLLTRRRQPEAEEPPFAEIDFASTKAYCFGYGGQIYVGELTRAAEDTGFARELADALASIRHPETDAPAFEVKTKEDLYRGAFYEKAPELVLLPFDERVHVESSHQQWPAVFERHERLLVRGSGHFSGQHARTGILAAAGPGIRSADMPKDADITRLPATLLALFGVAADLDGAPLDEILDPVITSERIPVTVAARAPVQRPVYSKEEEARMIERLRDLGYE